MEVLLNAVLRVVLLALGVGAAVQIARWIRAALRDRRERWAFRIAVGMLVLAAVYAAGHARLLAQRQEIEEGRARYALYGDPRLAEIRRAEVRGWILDCTGEEEKALARYSERNGVVDRAYPLGAAGANLIGGGEDAGERDFTVERLFTEQLREPRSLLEFGEPHPVGTDLRLTLCSDATARAWELLRETGRQGAIVVQEVESGALVAYAATGGPNDAPLGMKRYAAPGSVFKLALAAAWWESDMPPAAPIPCPPRIDVTPRASIGNFGGVGYGTIEAPREMLVFSCNTAAVDMALRLRERIGSEAFVEAYRRFGFAPYPPGEDPPGGVQPDFWRTGSERWAERMSPPPARIRMGEKTGRAEWAQLAIGQGPVDVTPIHVSRFLQAIGNGGVMLPPVLEWEQAESRPEGTRVMRPETAERLQAAMREVVDRGTARSVARVLDGTEWDLGGKTGTAQVRGAPDDGWFSGLVFGPQGEARYTVVVYLRGGGPGGALPARAAAGLARHLAKQRPVLGELSLRSMGEADR